MNKDIVKLPKQWKLSNLSEISEINRTTLNPEKTFHTTEFSYIDIDSIENETGRIKHTKKYKGHDAPSRARRMVKFNDVIMSTVRPYLKAFAIIPKKHENHICSTGFAVLSPHENINSKYLLYSLFSRYVIYQCKKMMVGAQYPALNESQVKKIKIPLPPLPEQKKIAEILSTVDLASEKVNNSLKKNEIIFYGLVQYLFHNNIKNWGNETLNNLSNSIVGGGTPSTSKSEFWNGNIAWMTSAHISNRDIVNGQKYITKTGLEKSSSKLVAKNNIIIATRVGIGKVALNKIDVAISQDLTGIFLEHDKIVPDFLYYFFLTQKNKLKALAQGSTIKGILKDDISKLNIPLPSLSIQRKIVAILNSFYEKQELLNKKKEKLTSIKKGLMNDLLTGQKRVRLES